MPIYSGSGTQQPGMQTHSSGGPVFAYLTITDIQPFLGKWGIFTLSSGQKVVAYVNTVNADSISVLFADGKSAVIDVKMISMAEGPFPTMPATPGSGSGGDLVVVPVVALVAALVTALGKKSPALVGFAYNNSRSVYGIFPSDGFFVLFY